MSSFGICTCRGFNGMRPIDRIVRAAVGLIISHRKIVLVVLLLCAAALGWQARFFRIDASADTLLMQDNRNYIQTQIVNRRFSPQEFLLIAYQPEKHPVFSEQTFNDLRLLANKLNEMERVESVRSILNVPLFLLAEDSLTSMADPDQWAMENRNYEVDTLKSVFENHPLYENLLINTEQNAVALQVLFKSNEKLEGLKERILELQAKSLDQKLSTKDKELLHELRAEAEPIRQQLDKIRKQEVEAIRDILVNHVEDAKTYMGGVHVLAYQLIKIITNDLVVFGSAIALIICLVLFMLFGRIYWVAIPVLCCGYSILSTMGLFGMLGLKATVISSNFIALQIILTLAIVIHLIVQYREYRLANPEWDQEQLVRKTLTRKAAPCLYAGITTSIGFGSLIFSNIQPVISFGWMMIIALLISTVSSLILFPALLASIRAGNVKRSGPIPSHFLKACQTLVLKHPLLVGGIAVLILGINIAGLLRLKVENSFLNYFRESTRVYKELSFIDREFGGSTPLDLVYTLEKVNRQTDLEMTAEHVQKMQQIQYALNQYDAVGKIISVVNFTELGRKINDNRPLTEYELTAIYWTMEDSLREDLLGAFFSPEQGQVRFSIRIQDQTKGLNRTELLRQIRGDLEELDIAEDHYFLSNLFVLYQDILQRLFRSQIITLGIVYVALSLTFLVIFRSFKVALIGMIPNLFSTIVVLGVMGWLKIPLDLMTITIAAIAVGIAVDDTIHYIHRYREELKEVASARAVLRSHSSVGYAIFYTTLIIVLGFSMLSFSEFWPSVLFGLLTGLAMITALVSDLCVLPVLLNRFVKE